MTYRLDITKQAQEDITFHRKSGNKAVLNKIAELLDQLIEHPFTGTGKPEPLKHNLFGMWSIRINREHRYVYPIAGDTFIVASLKGH